MPVRHTTKLLLSLSALAILTPAAANAAGFYIQEQSVRGLGSAFSGSVTSIDDASTVYFNPAGMTKLDRAQVNLGAHLLVPSAKLKDNGSTFDANGPAAGRMISLASFKRLDGAWPSVCHSRTPSRVRPMR